MSNLLDHVIDGFLNEGGCERIVIERYKGEERMGRRISVRVELEGGKSHEDVTSIAGNGASCVVAALEGALGSALTSGWRE